MNGLNWVAIALALIDNKEPIVRLTPEADGYLGKIAPGSATSVAGTKIGHAEIGMKIKLAVRIMDAERNNVFGIVVDNQKNVTPKANTYRMMDPKMTLEENRQEAKRQNRVLGNGKSYCLDIQVKWSEKAKCLHTEYPFNNLRLLRFDGNTVEDWEISVNSQNGKFFLNTQKVYTWKLFKNEAGDQIITLDDSLIEWPQMMKVLTAILNKRIESLPLLNNNAYLSLIESDEAPATLSEYTGQVVYCNHANNGRGVIRTIHGLARVHWSEMPARSKNGNRYLVAGEIVTFARLVTPRTTPDKPTTFKWEAIGVKNL